MRSYASTVVRTSGVPGRFFSCFNDVLSTPLISRKMFTMENHNDVPRLPRKRRSLAQELVTVLSEQIRDGMLKRGDKLPTESAIMEAHGVSRTVVREAISRLQAAGQVETRHGIGTFVLDTPSPSGFRIDPATVVTLRDVLAILELRISLEVESAGLAAQRRSAEHLAAMRAALDALNENTARDGDAVAGFHLTGGLQTGNRLADHGAADAMGFHDRRLGGQLVATLEQAITDLLAQHRHQFLGEAAALAGEARGVDQLFHGLHLVSKIRLGAIIALASCTITVNTTSL